MSWRVKAEDVRDIIDDDNDINISPFVATANLLTTRLSEKDTESVLSAAMLLEIEKYLSAHFYEHRDPLAAEKQTGKASAAFQGKFGMGLESTKYGQTAIMLDETGWLKKSSKGTRQQSIGWLGKPSDDWIDYEDR